MHRTVHEGTGVVLVNGPECVGPLFDAPIRGVRRHAFRTSETKQSHEYLLTAQIGSSARTLPDGLADDP